FQAEDGIRDLTVTGVQTCALPISFIWLLSYEVAARLHVWLNTQSITGYFGSSNFFGNASCCTGVGVEPAGGVSGTSLCPALLPRSEERRVGKGCRSRWWPWQ